MDRTVTSACFLLASGLLMGLTYDSLGGRTITVRFETPAPNVPTDPDKPLPTAGLSYKRYKVAFYENGHSTPLAVTEYFDIYGPAPEAHPTPVDDLIRGILWSPEKDFAVLGKENWPASKGPSF